MDQERILNDELEMQHFGFSSTWFITEFKELLKEDIEKSLRALEKTVIDKGAEDAEVIREEMKNLQDKYIAVRNEVMQDAEEKIREFFAIPKEVIPHIHWNRYSIPTDESIEDLENQVEKLEKQLVKEKVFQQLLEKEVEGLRALEPVYEQVQTVLNAGISFEDPPLTPKTQKLLQKYDEAVTEFSEDSADGVKSAALHHDLFN